MSNPDPDPDADLFQNETENLPNTNEALIPAFSKEPLTQADTVEKVLWSYVAPVDEFLATPLANVNAIEDACGEKFYDTINKSANAIVWHGVLITSGFLALTIGAYVAAYRDLRNREKKSHFFYFKRLLDTANKNEIQEIMGDFSPEDKLSYKLLSVAAHFYFPDVFKIVNWKRRVFCWGSMRKELNALKAYLSKQAVEGKTQEKALDEIFQETIRRLAKFLNKKFYRVLNYNKFEPGDNYSIKFTEAYYQALLDRKKKQDQGQETLRVEYPLDKKKPAFIWSILAAIGQASFIYWLSMFAFYFAPVWVIAGITVPPLAIASAALIFLLVRTFYKQYKNKNNLIDENVNDHSNDAKKQREDNEINSVELAKREAFFDSQKNNICRVNFKDSKVKQEIKRILSKRRFSRFHAMLQGFTDGCLLPFFGIWLFNDLFKLIAGLALGVSVTGPAAPAIFTSIFMGIAALTLALGLANGIYSAIKAVRKHEEEYKNLEYKFDVLNAEIKKSQQIKSDIDNNKIADLSLQEYDRVLRRYRLEQPTWTRVKKVLNRAWVVLKRLGTGSLVFRLVIWGSITAFLTVPAAWIAPISIPLIVVFAVIMAGCYWRAYNVRSQFKRAENVVDYLSQFQLEKKIDEDLPKEAINSEKLSIYQMTHGNCKKLNIFARTQSSSSVSALVPQYIIAPVKGVESRQRSNIIPSNVTSKKNLGDKVMPNARLRKVEELAAEPRKRANSAPASDNNLNEDRELMLERIKQKLGSSKATFKSTFKSTLLLTQSGMFKKESVCGCSGNSLSVSTRLSTLVK